MISHLLCEDLVEEEFRLAREVTTEEHTPVLLSPQNINLYLSIRRGRVSMCVNLYLF